MTDRPLLAADSVDLLAGGRSILRGAYVDAMPGAVTALVGRSGAGKTTLFEVLVGRRRPLLGQVRWGGERVERVSLAWLTRRGLCYLPGQRWLPTGLSVGATLDLASGRLGRDWEPTTSTLGVAAWRERRIDTLSGGELRLTELAFALVRRPRAVLLDEPFRGLEPLHREAVGRALRRMADDGVAVLYADHDARLVGGTADRLFSIEMGTTRPVPDFRSRPLAEWYHAWPQ
jgi:ABC-type multidrug transport system ATPase subunit